ncbi:hypothetical protein BDBG_07177 [Blastomyces gilchristii SLH14081]|uniref:Uncharacterized protein n=1 Tax=Blastomyces gilchristii (strain SLH14081) TaxID=559298 RepID=A0A179UUE7_BLAGS|nr:uncharacterized protein BDBG_07177 [Blastomyces gilchristii SLH14081]OAT11745.1 hypothetical protein BDBG_07177 [Blastomyces gilchristii SLH14081]
MRLSHTMSTLLLLAHAAIASALPISAENANELNKRMDQFEISWLSAPNEAGAEEPAQRRAVLKDEAPNNIDKRLPKLGMWASPKEEVMFMDNKEPASGALAARH